MPDKTKPEYNTTSLLQFELGVTASRAREACRRAALVARKLGDDALADRLEELTVTVEAALSPLIDTLEQGKKRRRK